MHELSIVQTLIDEVLQQVEQAGCPGRVVGIHLTIGRLSGVHVDSIRFAFAALAPESPLDGAALTIDEPRARCACADCGASSAIDEFTAACPVCGGGSIRIEGGREMLLESIEIEES